MTRRKQAAAQPQYQGDDYREVTHLHPGEVIKAPPVVTPILDSILLAQDAPLVHSILEGPAGPTEAELEQAYRIQRQLETNGCVMGRTFAQLGSHSCCAHKRTRIIAGAY